MMRTVGIVLLLVAGCSGRGNSCEEVENRVLAEDEPSPEGVTGIEVLARAGEPYEHEFVWQPGMTNASPEEALTVSVQFARRAAEPVRYIVTESTGDTREALGCGAAIHVPVDVVVQTSDGALDETFDTDLVYRTSIAALDPSPEPLEPILEDFSFDELNGSLRPADSPEESSGSLQIPFGGKRRGLVEFRQSARTEGGDGMESGRLAGYWGPTPPW